MVITLVKSSRAEHGIGESVTSKEELRNALGKSLLQKSMFNKPPEASASATMLKT